MYPSSLYFTTQSAVWAKSPVVNSLQTDGVNSSVLGEFFIGPVEFEIFGHITKRYTIASVVAEGGCPILSAIATREAIYRVLIERGLVQFPPPQQGRHPFYQQHLDDQKLLERIAEGRIQLVTQSNNEVNADLSDMEMWHNNIGYQPTFREDRIENSFVDQNKLDDIADDRETAD